MEVLSTIFYFIVTIGILVFVHELGHFLAAKFFKMRVDTFSIGFPPRAFGKQIGETDYCISWVPIGGYVKIAGMIDESFDTEFTNSPPQPWEFRAKPAWQKIIVLSAGVIMNLLLAIAIFWGIVYHQGRIIRPVTEIGYVAADSPAQKAGFQVNDRVESVNGEAVTHWDEIESKLYIESLSGDVTFMVRRAGVPTTLIINQSLLPSITDEQFGILPVGLMAIVSFVDGNMPAANIGLLPGDTLVSVNETQVNYGSLLANIRANALKPITLGWKRGDTLMSAVVTPNEEGRIGITLGAAYQGPVVRTEYGLFEALPVGAREVFVTSGLFLENIYQIFAGRVSLSKSVGGPIRIAQMANRSAESGLVSFLGFMALLSVSLALLNILPFPALDGGHIMFVAFEGIFRREIPTKVKIWIQKAGFALLLAFMAFVIYNDILHF